MGANGRVWNELEMRVETMDKGVKEHFLEMRDFAQALVAGAEKRLRRDMAASEKRLSGRLDRFERDVKAAFQVVDGKFARIDERFLQIDERFMRLENRMDRLEVRLTAVEARIARVEAGMARVVARLGRVETKLRRVDSKLDLILKRLPQPRR